MAAGDLPISFVMQISFNQPKASLATCLIRTAFIKFHLILYQSIALETFYILVCESESVGRSVWRQIGENEPGSQRHLLTLVSFFRFCGQMLRGVE